MIKLIERSNFIQDDRRLVNVSVYERQDGRWAYSGSMSISPTEWEKMKACLEVGAEDNPVEFDLVIEKGE